MGSYAQAATNNTINFQARVLTNAGAVVPDGNYSVQFKMYNTASGGTALWTETHNPVLVKSGYVSVPLGSITSFPSNINWDQELWLTMNVNSDGEMNPRMKVTSVPFAQAAAKLQQTNGSFTSTLSLTSPTGGNQVFQVPDQGAAGTYNLCIQNSNDCGFAPGSGSSSYIQNQNALQQAASNFWISGTGRLDSSLLTPLIDTPSAAALNIGTTNATQINLNQNTVIANNKTLSVTGATTLSSTLQVNGNTTLGDANTDTTTIRGLTVLSDSSSTYPLRFGTDVNLYRGAANRLDLATGDSLNLVNGDLQVGATTVISSARTIQNATGITSSGNITLSGLTANRLVTTTTGGQLSNLITSSNLALSVSDETGTGALVFATSPTFTTSITTPLVYGSAAANGTLVLQGNSASTGNTATNANIQFKVGNSGATTAMTILNNGNVGIGTTNPLAPLHVNSSGTTNETLPGFIFSMPSTTNKTRLQNYYPGLSYLSQNYYRDASGSGWLKDNASNSIASIILNTSVGAQGLYFITGTNAASAESLTRMYIDTSGRVGINTGVASTLTSSLQVNSIGSSSVVQIIRGAASQTADLLQIQNSAGTSLVNVTSGGDVGIGTSTPLSELDLSNGIISRYNSTWTGINDSVIIPTQNLLAFADKVPNYVVTASSAPDGGSISNLFDESTGTIARWNSAKLPVTIQIDYDKRYSLNHLFGVGFYSVNFAEDIKIEVYDDVAGAWSTITDISNNSTDSYSIYSYKNYVTKIRYTLGSANNGSSISVSSLVDGNTFDRKGYYLSKGGDTMFGNLNMANNAIIGGTGSTDILKLQGTTANGTTASAAIQMLVGNNGATTAMTVLNNGNVGIGTGSPSQKLEVVGGILAISNSNASIFSTRVGGASVRFEGGGAAGYLRTSTNHPIYIGTNNIDRLTIDTDGKIGINTYSPNSQLQVNAGSSSTVGAIIRGAASQTADLLQIQDSSGTSLVKVTAGGNVGVGVTNPTVKFQVNSGTSFTAALFEGTDVSGNGIGLTVRNNSTANSSYAIYRMEPGGIFFGSRSPLNSYGIVNGITFRSDTGKDIGFTAENSLGNLSGPSIILKAGGNLGIGLGSTAPTAQLQVHTRASNTVGQIIRGAVSQTADLLQVQNSAGSSLVKVTASGVLEVSSSDALINGLTVGRGGSNIATNTASGSLSLLANTTGSNNTAQGSQALRSNTTGSFNTAQGFYALRFNTTGSYNTAMGNQSLYSNTTGGSNMAIGHASLLSNTTGSTNAGIGQATLFSLNSGSNNIAIGSTAGRYFGSGTSALTTANNSLFLGVDTRASADDVTNEIVIGASAIGNGSNTVTLGNTSITKTILQGSVGIGTTSPTTELEVVGDITSAGTKWATRSSAVDNSWRSVTYGNGLFVAVSYNGSGNRVMTSPDGINWTARSSAADNNWRSVTYGNGLFVAVASSGSGNRVMTSPDGINWTTRSSAADNEWRSVTYGNGLFVAVAETGSGNRVMTSPDGINWTIRTSAADIMWSSITYGNGLFVAVAETGSGNRVMTSPDGISWTIRTSAADNYWFSVTYGNGLFVAVAYSGSGNRVMTSPDGINWTARSSAADNEWLSVTYGNGLFVAVSHNGSGNRVMTSPDGINWTIRTSATDNNWFSVTYGNGLFVAVSYNGSGNRVMTSGKTQTSLVPNNNTYQGGMKVYGSTQLISDDDSANSFLVQTSGGINLISADSANRKVGIGTTTPLSQLQVTSVDATFVGQIIRGSVSQVADLLQIQKTDGNIVNNVFTVSNEGNTSIAGNLSVTGATTLSSTLQVNGNTTLGDANTDTTTIRGLTVLSDSSSTYPLRFGTDVNLYRGAANRLDLATGDSLNLVNGNLQQGAVNRLTSTGLFQATNGTAGGPAYSFSDDTNTGMYNVAADTLGFATNGVTRMQVSDTAVTNSVPLIFNQTNGINTYKNVYSYTASSGTGTFEIVMPKSWSNTMMRLRIVGYNYSGTTGAWEATIGGYNFTSTFWYNTSAEIKGKAPFSSIRLGHNGTNNVILLGDTSTSWSYPRIVIEEFIATGSSTAIEGWETGWSGSFITDETGRTSINSPTIQQVGSSVNSFFQGGNSFGASAVLGTNDNFALDLETNGTKRWSITTDGILQSNGSQTIQTSTGDLTLATLAGNGNIIFTPNGNGNVGIGTTTPSEKLSVSQGSSAVALRLERLNSIGDVVLQFTDTISKVSTIRQRASDGSIQINPYSNLLIPTGNVGIGTTSPVAKLQVNTGSSTTVGQIIRGAASQTADLLQIQNSAGSNLFKVDSSGNGLFGTNASSLTATPLNLSLGGTYGNSSPGSVDNLKLDLFNSGAGNRYGIGMSSNLMEFQAGNGGGQAFFVNQGTEALRILSNGNVGIGRDNPQVALQVARTNADAEIRVSTFTSGDAILRLNAEGSNGGRITYERTGSKMTFTNGGVEALRIMTTGNVAIGAVNPRTVLEVSSNNLSGTDKFKQLALSNRSSQVLWAGAVADSIGSYIMNNANYFSSNLYTPNYTASSGINFTQGGATRFFNNSGLTAGVNYLPTETMVIQSNGRVGINSSSPGSQLQVNAGSASTVGAIIRGAASQTADLLQIQNSAGAVISRFTNNGNLILPDGNASNPSISFSSNNDTGIYRSGADDISFAQAGDETVRFINIGSGPTYSGQIQIDQYSVGSSADNYPGYSFLGDSDTGLLRFGEDALGLSTGGATQLYVGTNNIGIGTTSPDVKLEVSDSSSGVALFSSTATNIHTGKPVLDVQSADTTVNTITHDLLRLQYNAATGASFTTGRYISFADSTGIMGDIRNMGTNTLGINAVDSLRLLTNDTERLRVDSSGNVGIGITNPTAKLEIADGTITSRYDQNGSSLLRLYNSNTGSSASVGFQLNNGTANVYNYLWGSGVSGSAYIRANGYSLINSGSGIDLGATNASGDIKFWTGGSNQRMVIDSSGNVGIGTISPARKLTIQDNNPLRLGTATDYFDVVQRNANVWGWLSSSGKYPLTLNTDGKVGINSASTINSQLEVITNNASTIGNIIKGAASQTADLTQWQDNSGNVLAEVTSSGAMKYLYGGPTGSALQNVATDTFIQSRGQNLITNGFGFLQDNTNFSSFVYDQKDHAVGLGGFTHEGTDTSRLIDEFIAVDSEEIYNFSYYIKMLDKSEPTETPRFYSGIVAYDADGFSISAANVYKYPGSTYTSLAADLNNGDTTITLTDATGWQNGGPNHQRSIGFYPYTNSQGFTYPDYTYTRDVTGGNAWSAGGISGNVITLSAPWSGGFKPAGTKVSNNISSGTYEYLQVYTVTPTEHTKFNDYMGKVDGDWDSGDFVEGQTVQSGHQQTSPGSKLRWGTARIKLLYLLGYNTPVGTTKTIISGVSFGLAENAKQSLVVGNFANSNANSNLQVTNNLSTSIGAVIKGAASQTADLLQIQNSAGTSLVKVTASGGLEVSSSDALINGLTVGRGGGDIYGNTAIGESALQINTSGAGNTALGFRSLYSNTTGSSNTVQGHQSLYSNTTGDNNTTAGFRSLYSNTTGSSNTALGQSALYSNTTGSTNTAIGQAALYLLDSGSNNTALGSSSGRYFGSGSSSLTTANNSLFLGYNSRASADDVTNEIVIGSSAVGNGSNSVTLGNTSITKTILQGSVGIGTTSPTTELEVVGDITSAGTKWTSRTSAANNEWLSVTYGNGLFVAIAKSGSGNRVMTSPDGINWTARTSAADNEWISVTYGNGLFVAVAQSGSGNRVMISSNGINWTVMPSASDANWRSVTYGNGLFVAVASSGAAVMTSPDGRGWTARSAANANNWVSVTYGNGLFVAVAYSGSGNRVMTSPDGINWTARTSAANNDWWSVTYGNGLFVAVSNTGSGNRVMTSPDGINWTARTSAADNSWHGLTYANGMFVAVSYSGSGNRVMTSGKLNAISNNNDNILLGNVGIANNAPGFLLHVGSTSISTGASVTQFQNAGGTCTITPSTAGGVTCTSDIRNKKNIADYDSKTALNKILGLNTITYNMNSDPEGFMKKVGFGAQDMELLLPDLVVTDEAGYKSISYSGLTPYLVSAVQEQQSQIDEAKSRLSEIENSIQPSSNLLDLTFGGTIQGTLNIIGNINTNGSLTALNITVTNDINVGARLTTKELAVQDIMISGKIITLGDKPTISLGEQSGVADIENNIATPEVTIEGNDTSGTITIIAGANTEAGEVAKIDFSSAYSAKPRIIISPANRDSAKVGAYHDSSSVEPSGFSLMVDQALETAKTYSFTYFIVQ